MPEYIICCEIIFLFHLLVIDKNIENCRKEMIFLNIILPKLINREIERIVNHYYFIVSHKVSILLRVFFSNTFDISL